MENNLHTFHIPVMGLAFTIDTPIKVAKFGISSVVPVTDDLLAEQMRKFYCMQYKFEYIPIAKYDYDHRARRITAWLNLLNNIVNKQFAELKKSGFDPGSELYQYLEMLPESSNIKKDFNLYLSTPESSPEKKELESKLIQAVKPGSIDVNIMTKLDKLNYSKKGDLLPSEFSDALASLRGYANSDLDSSVVFSAGLNPRLFTYIEGFKDFFPNSSGKIKKRIIIKVSDYRSALIQGKFLAKKGLWVSEFRVESGLNCGGHAFATDGLLLGPILEEFKTKKETLTSELFELFAKSLKEKNKNLHPSFDANINITVQGGIGTADEHQFLLENYNMYRTGWGTPFLLVPDATNVDLKTLKKLLKAGPEDLYLSNVSPLGVPFNTLKTATSIDEKKERVHKGVPGSPCIKKHLQFNTEFTDKPLCTASKEYQKLKIEQLANIGLPEAVYQQEYEKVIDKECLCVGLANSALINAGVISHNKAVSICPGPNLAFFSKISTLKEMIAHIYGKTNILNERYRPNMFINELKMYVDYLENMLKEKLTNMNDKKEKAVDTFKTNLLIGIDYYFSIIPNISNNQEYKIKIKKELEDIKNKILNIEVVMNY